MPRYKHGVHIHVKGYPRCKSGPMRDKLIHRVVAAAMIGRELNKSEEVHHLDGDRRNFHWLNLMVVGHEDHGWVSAKQAWFMREKDRKEKLEWDAFMAEEDKKFRDQVDECRVDHVPWPGPVDGMIRESWETRTVTPTEISSDSALFP